jgi:3-oxoacyl-[acyl-carrier-protein] synthase III
MAGTPSVGIHGVGAYLPPDVRQNQWWPESLVSKWRGDHTDRSFQRIVNASEDAVGGAAPPMTEGARMVLERQSALKQDMFQGVVERRVMLEGVVSSDMETAAAREALAQSEVDPKDIDLLLTYSQCPDTLCVPNACIVHRDLGLPEKCFTVAMDGVCNSFLLQLSMAEQMIAAGRSRFALLVQSSGISRLLNREDQFSIFFGDGATAAVVGPVTAGRGILGRAHRTDGNWSRGAMCGIPGRRWYDEGRVIAYVDDPRMARQMLLAIPDRARQVVSEALAEAGLGSEDIGFYACHQGTAWMRAITQEYLGLINARSADTFSWTGSLSASNIPFMLVTGQRSQSLRDGDPVVLFTGGGGMTWSALVLRWGK